MTLKIIMHLSLYKTLYRMGFKSGRSMNIQRLTLWRGTLPASWSQLILQGEGLLFLGDIYNLFHCPGVFSSPLAPGKCFSRVPKFLWQFWPPGVGKALRPELGDMAAVVSGLL